MVTEMTVMNTATIKLKRLKKENIGLYRALLFFTIAKNDP
jgi:hypothetical protein